MPWTGSEESDRVSAVVEDSNAVFGISFQCQTKACNSLQQSQCHDLHLFHGDGLGVKSGLFHFQGTRAKLWVSGGT